MHKFFKNENKNTDHSLKVAVLSCALGGLLCACTFSLTTFAWFTDTVTSPQSTIAAGTYSMEIEISPETEFSYKSHWGRYGEKNDAIKNGATVTVADGNAPIVSE